MNTANDIIDTLGGTAEVSRLTGRGMAAVSMWRATGRIPPAFYEIIKQRIPSVNCEIFSITPARTREGEAA